MVCTLAVDQSPVLPWGLQPCRTVRLTWVLTSPKSVQQMFTSQCAQSCRGVCAQCLARPLAALATTNSMAALMPAPRGGAKRREQAARFTSRQQLHDLG